jgi:hypothetical protein
MNVNQCKTSKTQSSRAGTMAMSAKQGGEKFSPYVPCKKQPITCQSSAEKIKLTCQLTGNIAIINSKLEIKAEDGMAKRMNIDTCKKF